MLQEEHMRELFRIKFSIIYFLKYFNLIEN